MESGYIYNVLFPSKTVEYLGGYVRKVMNEKCTVEEALQAIDRFYCEGTDESSYDFSVIGTVSRDLLLENFNVRFMETELGNFIADCVAEASGAPDCGGQWRRDPGQFLSGSSVRRGYRRGVPF